jgi:hypothetical protein
MSHSLPQLISLGVLTLQRTLSSQAQLGEQASAESFFLSVLTIPYCSDKLFGMAEGLWEEDLGPEELFETISQTLLGALERDALSGWGAVVRVM